MGQPEGGLAGKLRKFYGRGAALNASAIGQQAHCGHAGRGLHPFGQNHGERLRGAGHFLGMGHNMG